MSKAAPLARTIRRAFGGTLSVWSTRHVDKAWRRVLLSIPCVWCSGPSYAASQFTREAVWWWKCGSLVCRMDCGPCRDYVAVLRLARLAAQCKVDGSPVPVRMVGVDAAARLPMVLLSAQSDGDDGEVQLVPIDRLDEAGAPVAPPVARSGSRR